jgi:hypothetical protein
MGNAVYDSPVQGGGDQELVQTIVKISSAAEMMPKHAIGKRMRQ